MNTNKSNEIHRIFQARAKNVESGKCICGRKILKSFYQKKNKKYLCECLVTVSPMAGTPMNKSHIPLTTWFGLINDILTSTAGINVKYVQDKYHLSNTSAYGIIHKIKGWLNHVEENEHCTKRTHYVVTNKWQVREYHLKYPGEIPHKIMEKKMLQALPPLFCSVQEARTIN